MSPEQPPFAQGRRDAPPAGGPADRRIAEAAFAATARSTRRGSTGTRELTGAAPAAESVRLLVLLTTLLAVTVALVAIRTNTFSAAGNPGPVTPNAFAPGCPAYQVPQVVRVPPAGLVALGGKLASLPPHSGRIYESGMIDAGNAWTDDRPTALDALRSDDGLVSAGYEVRWWARRADGSEDDVAADAWEFASVAEAQEFAARAADPRCRRSAGGRAAIVQSGARVLFWVNPDNAAEWDVVVARGRFAYRSVVVPPTYSLATGSAADRALERRRAGVRAQALACAFPDAGCHFARGGSLS
jgi:hypothetical protein